MLRVLRNLAVGVDPLHHLEGRSASGNFAATKRALIERGWIDPDSFAITDAGLHVSGCVKEEGRYWGYTCHGCKEESPEGSDRQDVETRAYWAGWHIGHDNGQGHYACLRCKDIAIWDALPIWPTHWRGTDQPLPKGGREQLLRELADGSLYAARAAAPVQLEALPA